MTLAEKCQKIGLGGGRTSHDYPVINGRIIQRRNGKLGAYLPRPNSRAYQDPYIEDQDFPVEILSKIEAIEGDDLDLLTPEEKQIIEGAIAAKDEAANAPSLMELDKRLKAVEAALG